MKPNKIRQLEKFHTPLPDENPDQLYVVLQIIENVERPRTDVKALNIELSFPYVNNVLLDDLEVLEVDNSDLIGDNVTLNKLTVHKRQGSFKTIGVK